MDHVFLRFLENTATQALQLTGQSDAFDLVALPPTPPSRYLCEFRVAYLRKDSRGLIEVASGPVMAAIHFHEGYLRSTDPALGLKVVSMMTTEIVHPNIRGGTVCLGSSFSPATPLAALLWTLYQLFTYATATLDERNAMNAEACRLLRMCPEVLDQLPAAPAFLRSRRALTINSEGKHA